MTRQRQMLISMILANTSVWLGHSLAFGQTCNLAGSPANTLRTPLIPGSVFTIPGSQAPLGQAPPLGSGTVPTPVTQGQVGPPTLLPYIPYTPGGIAASTQTVPFNSATESRPGDLGPSINSPSPSSTPGSDPGTLPGPMDFYPPPGAAVVNINPGGGLPSTMPPKTRWGGQTTADFGRLGWRNGQQTPEKFGARTGAQSSQDGPYEITTTLPNAQSKEDRYGMRNTSGIQTIVPIAPH